MKFLPFLDQESILRTAVPWELRLFSVYTQVHCLRLMFRFWSLTQKQSRVVTWQIFHFKVSFWEMDPRSKSAVICGPFCSQKTEKKDLEIKFLINLILWSLNRKTDIVYSVLVCWPYYWISTLLPISHWYKTRLLKN